MLAVALPARRPVAIGPGLRHALAGISAGAVILGTFLPWRKTALGASDGWRTADLAVGLSTGLEEPGLRVVALIFFAVPLLALAAVTVTVLRNGREGLLLARGLSVSSLLSAVVVSILIRQEPLVHATPHGPAVVCAASALLILTCWPASAGHLDPTNARDDS